MLNFRICRSYTGLPQFIALHFIADKTDNIFLCFWFFFFTNWKVCTTLHPESLPEPFFHSICSLVFVSYFDNFCNISNCFLVIIFTVVSVISNVWCYYWNCLRAPWTIHKTEHLIDECCTCSDCFTFWAYSLITIPL